MYMKIFVHVLKIFVSSFLLRENLTCVSRLEFVPRSYRCELLWSCKTPPKNWMTCV